MVIKTTGSWYIVRISGGNHIQCRIKGGFRREGSRSTNPAVVGDQVRFLYDEEQDTGIINFIEDRKNHIVRRATKLSKQSQVIASNIDQAILMVTMIAPETYLEFIDRYLVSAEAYRIPAMLVFNKMDLYDARFVEKINRLQSIYSGCGYSCFQISAARGRIDPELIEMMKGRISLLSGNSGVGKSTFINSIDPSLELATSEISEYHQSGKHTTTFVEMHELSFGGFVIDTPGIRGFGLIHMQKDEIYHFFPEIFRHSHNCKYYNCKHINEPGCGVIKAVTEGGISRSRYMNYVNMYLDEDQKYRI